MLRSELLRVRVINAVLMPAARSDCPRSPKTLVSGRFRVTGFVDYFRHRGKESK